VRGLRGEPRVPRHQIRKALDLAGRLDQTHAGERRRNPRQSAGQREDQVGASNGEDCRHKEWDTYGGAPFQAKLRQRPIDRSLLTVPCFNHRVGKVEILFQREAAPANSLSGADETNEIFLIEHFRLEGGGCHFRTERQVESSSGHVLIASAMPGGNFHRHVGRRSPDALQKWRHQDRGGVIGQGDAKSLLAERRLEVFAADHCFQPRHQRLQLP